MRKAEVSPGQGNKAGTLSHAEADKFSMVAALVLSTGSILGVSDDYPCALPQVAWLFRLVNLDAAWSKSRGSFILFSHVTKDGRAHLCFQARDHVDRRPPTM